MIDTQGNRSGHKEESSTSVNKSKKTYPSQKKRVRFERDDRIKQVRFFAITDEPNAPPLHELDAAPIKAITTKSIYEMKKADMLKERTINSNKLHHPQPNSSNISHQAKGRNQGGQSNSSFPDRTKDKEETFQSFV